MCIMYPWLPWFVLIIFDCLCYDVFVVQDSPVTDRRADVIQAAYLASEIAHRMVVPGGEVS